MCENCHRGTLVMENQMMIGKVRSGHTIVQGRRQQLRLADAGGGGERGSGTTRLDAVSSVMFALLDHSPAHSTEQRQAQDVLKAPKLPPGPSVRITHASVSMFPQFIGRSSPMPATRKSSGINDDDATTSQHSRPGVLVAVTMTLPSTERAKAHHQPITDQSQGLTYSQTMVRGSRGWWGERPRSPRYSHFPVAL
ncbi:hypothetical protein K461DRAFT_264022 [Myriangium duriaei CBS 260.36]|uniref:Uncharacterized protein n=1 Tax=Myriangium duriaei CBS 260.36 TaxID=1168546 RepID=A0A9P4JCE2_9PEZI|nr:hypothetical protein K461DRAFT_264022 [Myriangium duriaei CBS 260.36]